MQTRYWENPVTTEAEWLESRIALLKMEKELTRLRDEISRKRREMPWRRIEKQYHFDAPEGQKTLAELFDGRSQLIVKHFMFAPGWKEGCVGCSFEVDHAEAARVHLVNHDVSYVAVSRAPLDEIQAFKERMGWQLPWVSSYSSDFNYDFHVSFTVEEMAKEETHYNYAKHMPAIEELSGNSVFYRNEDGAVFHTYSTYGRGGEEVLSTYMLLDMTPKGRNEPLLGNLTEWVRHHDRYGSGGHAAPTGRIVPVGGWASMLREDGASRNAISQQVNEEGNHGSCRSSRSQSGLA